MPEPHAGEPANYSIFPQPIVIASTAMDLFGLRTAKAKRRFTKYTVGGLFVLVTVLFVTPIFMPHMDEQWREAINRLVWYCMSAMFLLLTLQAIRNNEDAHLAKHDLRNELSPLTCEVGEMKEMTKQIEKQTNGVTTKKFEEVHQRIDGVIQRLDEGIPIKMPSDIVEAIARAAVRAAKEHQ